MALGDKISAIMENEKGVSNGIATLDENGKLTENQRVGAGNPNLLDNWYFASPINQRGQTEYNTFNTYSIDRWLRISSSTISLVSDGLQIVMTGSGGSAFQQKIDGYKIIGGVKYTMSYLLNDGSLYTSSFTSLKTGASVNFLNFRNVYNSIKYYSDHDYWTIDLVKSYNSTEENITIIAVKLELGDTQTLAHQDANRNWVLNDPPPDKQQELAKCQRYQMEVVPNYDIGANYGCCGIGEASSATNAYIFVSLPVTMREKPTSVFSGTWGLRNKNTALTSSIEVTNITVDRYSNNTLALRVTAEGLTVGDIYELWWTSAGSSLLFDANL